MKLSGNFNIKLTDKLTLGYLTNKYQFSFKNRQTKIHIYQLSYLSIIRDYFNSNVSAHSLAQAPPIETRN